MPTKTFITILLSILCLFFYVNHESMTTKTTYTMTFDDEMHQMNITEDDVHHDHDAFQKPPSPPPPSPPDDVCGTLDSIDLPDMNKTMNPKKLVFIVENLATDIVMEVEVLYNNTNNIIINNNNNNNNSSSSSNNELEELEKILMLDDDFIVAPPLVTTTNFSVAVVKQLQESIRGLPPLPSSTSRVFSYDFIYIDYDGGII